MTTIEQIVTEYIARIQTSSASIDKDRDKNRRLGFLAGYTHRNAEVAALRSAL